MNQCKIIFPDLESCKIHVKKCMNLSKSMVVFIERKLKKLLIIYVVRLRFSALFYNLKTAYFYRISLGKRDFKWNLRFREIPLKTLAIT